MVLVAPWLGKHISWAIFVISILLIVATISLLFITALTNPGYLPRSEESYSEDVEWGCAMNHPLQPISENILRRRDCVTEACLREHVALRVCLGIICMRSFLLIMGHRKQPKSMS